jgi:hypothetical protein
LSGNDHRSEHGEERGTSHRCEYGAGAHLVTEP